MVKLVIKVFSVAGANPACHWIHPKYSLPIFSCTWQWGSNPAWLGRLRSYEHSAIFGAGLIYFFLIVIFCPILVTDCMPKSFVLYRPESHRIMRINDNSQSQRDCFWSRGRESRKRLFSARVQPWKMLNTLLLLRKTTLDGKWDMTTSARTWKTPEMLEEHKGI